MNPSTIELRNPPPFELGQQVFVPIFSGHKKGTVAQATIALFNAMVFRSDDNQLSAVIKSAQFNQWFDFARKDQDYQLSEFHATEAEALQALTFYAVDCSAEDWQKITGMLADGTRVEDDNNPQLASIDNSELTPCCANISDVRDLLFKCWQQGGLYQLDRDTIGVLLAGHESPLTLLRLRKVLKQLGIDW